MPLGWLLAPSAALFAVAAGSTLPVRHWNYMDPVAFSALPRASAALAGPLAAVCAAWFASRRSAPDTPLGLPVACRAGWPAVRAHLARLVPVWTVAYAAGFVPALLLAGSPAGAGGVEGAIVLGGLAVLASFTVAGYFAGAVVPLPATPLVAGVAAFTVVAAQDYVPESGWIALPVWPVVESVTREADPWFAALRIGLFILVGAGLGRVAAGVQARRAWWGMRPPWQPLVAGMALVALPVAVSLLAGTLAGLSPQRGQAGEGVCDEVEHVRVCVHEAKRTQLDPLSALAAGVFLPLAGVPPALVGVYDTALDPQRGAPTPVLERTPDVVWVSVPLDRPVAREAPRQIAAWAAGLPTCFDRAESGQPVDEPFTQSMALSEWLLDAAGFPSSRDAAARDPAVAAVRDRLDRAGDAGVAAWYSRHGHDVRACRSRIEDL